MTITTPLNDPNSSLVEGWTAWWNGDLSQAATICAEQVTVHFGGRAIAEAGDHVMDASGLADLIGAFRSTRPGLTYRVVEAHTTEQWGYCVWDAGRGDLNVGGIDTFRFIRGRISHVYSVTAERPMGR